MLDITSIPHLRIHRTRVPLPVREPSVLFFNVTSPETIGEVLHSHKLILHYNKYQRYHIPSRYKMKLFNRNVIETLYNERYDYVRKVQQKYPQAKLEMVVQNSTNLLIADMSKWNELYFDNINNSFNYMNRCLEYIEVMKQQLRDTDYKKFGNRIMIIDIEKWGEFTKVLGNYKYLNSPLLIFYYLIWKNVKAFKSLGDVNIILLSSNAMVRINPALCDTDTYRMLRMELIKLNGMIKWDDIDKEVHKLELSSDITNRMNSRFNFTGDKETEKIITKKVDEVVDKTDDMEEAVDKSNKALTEDQEMVKAITKSVKRERPTLSKRDEELRDKQRQIKLEKSSVGEILDNKSVAIESFKVDIPSVNENVKNIRYPNFEKTYNTYVKEADTLNSILQMNNAEIPVYVRDIKKENTSDELSYKETYTVHLEDANRVRHTLTFDMPIFVEDKFMYLNGNKKLINKQLFLKPIVKTKENEVQVVTNYNKIFVRRHGAKLSPKTEKLRKVLLANPAAKRGNNMLVNVKYKTTIEYDEIGKYFSHIKFGTHEFFFNQEKVLELAKNLKINVPDDKLLIGFVGRKQPLFVDHNTQMIEDKDLVDFIMEKAPATLRTEYDGATTGKKFLYTRATIMAKQVPLILLLGYCEGLSAILRKAEIKHHFTEKRPKVSENEGVVQFADGYLVYDKYPFANSLLMNAFTDVPTKGFNYEEFDVKEAYMSIFDVMFNQRNLVSAFDNFYDFMIDPITKEVLEHLDLPTTFVDVMLYTNELLADNSFVNENDMSLYRVRSNEIVNVYLYKAIADAYGEYRRTAYNNNPTKISIKKDHVVKSVLMAQTVEDYSILNPIVEVEKSRAISAKGPSGLNLAQAYTLDKRGYDPTMLGVIGISTSPDANVGVVRQLTMEPNITDARGFIEVKNDKLNELKDANLFSPAEMLSPLGVSRDRALSPCMVTYMTKLF